jgi:predicted metal-dependent hydrolase
MWSSGRSEASLEAGFPVPIEVRTIRNARRLRLRFDDGSGTLKLTCPPRTSRRKALAWALDQREWIEAQLARAEAAAPFEPGAVIPVEGAETKLVWAEGLPRTPALAAGELRCGGPVAGFSRRVETFLKRRALDVMSREAAEYAAKSGAAIRSISVADAGSRWGSCSSQGRIRLSWRLILTPPSVRRYVVAHEVAHLTHLNHGPDFKALEARLFGPGLAEAKAELRRLGPRLRRLGRLG